MKITSQQLKETELLRRLVSEVLIHSSCRQLPPVNESPVYLIEHLGRRPSKYITFGALMESQRRGIISERRMIQLWESSVDYQLRQLLTEAFMDDLKSAYETVKGGAIKLKDKMSAAASAAWEKANDMVLDLSLQAFQMATKSIDALKSAASKLWAANEKFKTAHPLLHKIISILVIMIIIYAIMSLFGSEAHAGVQTPGGEMSKGQYTAARGLLDQWGNAGDVNKIIDTGNAIKILDKAFESKDMLNLSELGSYNQVAFSKIQQLTQQAQGGDPEAAELLQKFLKIGSKLVVK